MIVNVGNQTRDLTPRSRSLQADIGHYGTALTRRCNVGCDFTNSADHDTDAAVRVDNAGNVIRSEILDDFASLITRRLTRVDPIPCRRIGRAMRLKHQGIVRRRVFGEKYAAMIGPQFQRHRLAGLL